MADATTLAKVPVFEGLPEAELADLAASVRTRSFREDEVIFHRDDPGAAFFIVESGRVKILLIGEDGRESLIALMSAGDSFGEMAVLDGENRSATAIALEPTRTLFIRGDDLMAFLERSPKAAMRFVHLLAKRLRTTNETLSDMVFFDVYGRVAKKLIDLSHHHGTPTANGTQIAVALTQQDLASLIGSSRESVNKVMKFFRDKGYIAVERQKITILNEKGLQRQITY
jgi:CRP/FNR family transcriptional regulator/CRP/FNR family cyclic AMP-dependent transcriptional regulator